MTTITIYINIDDENDEYYDEEINMGEVLECIADDLDALVEILEEATGSETTWNSE